MLSVRFNSVSASSSTARHDRSGEKAHQCPQGFSRCLTIRLTPIYITAMTHRAVVERSVHAASRCIVLAIRRSLSHNRDEFENGR
jgi:hypothetical protein